MFIHVHAPLEAYAHAPPPPCTYALLRYMYYRVGHTIPPMYIVEVQAGQLESKNMGLPAQTYSLMSKKPPQ